MTASENGFTCSVLFSSRHGQPIMYDNTIVLTALRLGLENVSVCLVMAPLFFDAIPDEFQ